jgi:ribonuclease P/MRP protein subunit POP5
VCRTDSADSEKLSEISSRVKKKFLLEVAKLSANTLTTEPLNGHALTSAAVIIDILLLPSPSVLFIMRFKNRYFLVEILWEGGTDGAASSAAAAAESGTKAAASGSPVGAAASRVVDPTLQSVHLQSSLRSSIRELFGDLTSGMTLQSLHVRYLNALTCSAIVRCSRDEHRTCAMAIALTPHLRGKACTLRTVHLGGTIRSCQKAAVKWQRRRIAELRKQVEEAAEAVSVGGSSVEAASPAAAPGSITLSTVLSGAAARSNQLAARSAQQSLRQLSVLLSHFQGAKAAHATAATSQAAAALAIQLARTEQSVAATPAALTAALDAAQSTAEVEIGAMEG